MKKEVNINTKFILSDRRVGQLLLFNLMINTTGETE